MAYEESSLDAYIHTVSLEDTQKVTIFPTS